MSAPSSLPAAERAALMMQLVPYLLNHGEVSVAQAAADFDVSADRMRGMVEKLTVVGRPGEGGYWQLPNDLFDIDWDLLDTQDRIALTNTVGLEGTPRLTAREAAALLAGLQLAATLPGVAASAVIPPLLAKLATGTAAVPAELVVASAPVGEVQVAVDEALRRHVALSFTYKAPDAPATTRTVDPVRVHIANGQWYLQGWCHLRHAMRTFHLDRVGAVRLTGIPITHAADPVPELFEADEASATAHVRFRLATAPLLGGYLDQEHLAVDGEIGIAEVRVADAQSLKRLATGLGGDLEILDPPRARRAAVDWARAALALYPDDHA